VNRVASQLAVAAAYPAGAVSLSGESIRFDVDCGTVLAAAVSEGLMSAISIMLKHSQVGREFID
jgi:hypothetical protein